MMSNIKFSMAAQTHEGKVRTNNEDNFLVNDDLTGNDWTIKQNTVKGLGEKGCLMVVADGMGGMNAGEVASQLAVASVQEYFATERLTPQIMDNRSSIERYMNETIIAADKSIKRKSREDKETEGMGTTIVMAWIREENVYVGWCGDSRAYAWHPQRGLRRISRDHSYVQELVDEGQLSEENAFDHPDSNIITRSLGDPRKTAEPDFTDETIYDGEVILLCSDGLCGMIRDEEIEKVVRTNAQDMYACCQALIQAALDVGGHDNVTVTLCRIEEGAGEYPVEAVKTGKVVQQSRPVRKKTRLLYRIVMALFLIGVGFACKYGYDEWKQGKEAQKPGNSQPKQENDTVSSPAVQPPAVLSETSSARKTQADGQPVSSPAARSDSSEQPVTDKHKNEQKEQTGENGRPNDLTPVNNRDTTQADAGR